MRIHAIIAALVTLAVLLLPAAEALAKPITTL